jgi:nucleotide-binding universal stress UspA family protein
MIDKILVGVDGSDPSINALNYAAFLADTNESKLIIISIVPELTYLSAASPRHGDLRGLQKEIEKDKKKTIEEQINRLKTIYPGMDARSIVKTGSVRKNILGVSREENVDLIVVGNRGKGGVASWMLGS